LGSGLAGLLLLLYPDTFPNHSTLEGVMLAGAVLGLACQQMADALIIKPFMYYASLVQLILLRRYIGNRMLNVILRELTLKYFLGEH